MATVYMLCGKVGSGKSTYAKKLKERYQAMILSCDDLMLSLFDEQLGDQHQLIQRKSMDYLYNLADELVSIGVNVVVDFGFWSKAERIEVKQHFMDQGITTELHYINTPEIQTKKQLQMRNEAITHSNSNVYHITEEMRLLFDTRFEEPTEDEISARSEDYDMNEQSKEVRIEGDTIDLRLACESDFEDYYVFVQEPESNRFTGTQGNFTQDDIMSWIRKISVMNDDRADFIIVAKETGEFLGEVVLNEMDSVNRSANIRIGVDTRHTGKGYGTEAMKLMLRYGFDTLKLHRIDLGVYTFNPRAIHVYEKIGFQREGILRDVLYSDGEFHDEIKMSILEEEFRGTI